jgi:hypothetical protein
VTAPALQVGAIYVWVDRAPESYTGGAWLYREHRRAVRLMVVAEGYAMVRIPGCQPFVVSAKALSKCEILRLEGRSATETIKAWKAAQP